MTDLREAAKQALEALEYEAKRGNDNAYEAERKALKRALAEDAMDKMAENARELGLDYEPTIQTQIGKDISKWIGLTEEELLETAQLAERGNYLVAFQRIQQKLQEKNA